jgi:tetratricopeptide (TPR) repeat protein
MALNAQELFEQGRTLHRAGKLADAATAFQRCIEMEPRADAACAALGHVLRDIGKLNEAVGAYQRALAIQSNHVGALNGLGTTLRLLKQYDRALTIFQQALMVEPGQQQTHHNLGLTLAEMGRPRDAINAFRRTLELAPRSHGTFVSLLEALASAGENAAALETSQRAVKLWPNDAGFHADLGRFLFVTDQPEAAVAAYQRAVDLDPGLLLAHNNLGNALRQLGRFDQAKAEFAKCLTLQPDFAPAHWNMSLLRLLEADLPGAWEEYESRLQVPELSIKHSFTQPRWDGGELDGRRILLHAEQGFGDALHFVRYVPLVAARGGQVIVACHPELVWLLSTVEGVKQCVSLGQIGNGFDVHCPLMSLPHMFKTTLETVPANVPYIRADNARTARWKSRMKADDRKKIGLFWSGHRLPDQRRSARLSEWAGLSNAKGVRWISLQKGPASAEANNPPAGMAIDDWTIELIDFSDTAALMEALDLVITIDSAAAHLAGAMGKPVWLLLPQVPTWRWMLDRNDSPWYPTMRIFRQQRLGDWSDVIDRVVEELKTL